MLPLWHYNRGRGLKIQFAQEAYNRSFCRRTESVLHCMLEILVGPKDEKTLFLFSKEEEEWRMKSVGVKRTKGRRVDIGARGTKHFQSTEVFLFWGSRKWELGGAGRNSIPFLKEPCIYSYVHLGILSGKRMRNGGGGEKVNIIVGERNKEDIR
jgi:hypothetical protein